MAREQLNDTHINIMLPRAMKAALVRLAKKNGGSVAEAARSAITTGLERLAEEANQKLYRED